MKKTLSKNESDEPFEIMSGSSNWFRIQDFQSCDAGSIPVPDTK